VDKTIRYWDLDSAQQIHRLECEARVLCVAVSPDGHRALSGGEDGSLTLWNLDSGQQLWSRPGKLDGVRSLCYLPPDGHRAISGTQAGKLILWDVADEAGREIHRVDGTGVGRLGIAALSDGRHALTSDEDGFVRLWNFPVGR
jgi:WD40 repeat protein